MQQAYRVESAGLQVDTQAILPAELCKRLEIFAVRSVKHAEYQCSGVLGHGHLDLRQPCSN